MLYAMSSMNAEKSFLKSYLNYFFITNEAAIAATDAFVTGTLFITPPVPAKSEFSKIKAVACLP